MISATADITHRPPYTIMYKLLKCAVLILLELEGFKNCM